MVRNAGGWCLLAVLGGALAYGAQLPPEILLDQLLLRTERQVEADDLDPAVETMEDAFAFGAEHGLGLPPGLRFEHARVSFAVGLLEAAKASVTEYLTAAGREGESYEDALALLEDVDRILERRDTPDCSPEPDGTACWMELTSHPGCYVWNWAPEPDETAIWTGECSAGFAQGPGTLTWTYRDGEQEHEGNRRYGQPHGESVVRYSDGGVSAGPSRFGKRYGHWVLKFASGGVQQGPYVDGEKHGHWILKFTDERGIQEGPYVDGKMHGHWVQRFASGNVGEGPYEDGERNGRWIWTYPNGQVERGPYVDGEQHGRWRVRFPDGAVEYIEFVRGVRHEP